jgi:hypothetical protein
LGTARGRVYTPEELARHFAQAVLPRTTNRHGCVTLHSYHFYVEEGLPRTQVRRYAACLSRSRAGSPTVRPWQLRWRLSL